MSSQASTFDMFSSDASTTGNGSRTQQFLRTIWKNRTATIGLLILIVISVGVVAAPLLAQFDPASISLTSRLRPPAWSQDGTAEHLLGTDHLGRDLFSRILYGGRISVAVGLTTTVFACALGAFLGMIAGYYRGWFDLLMRLADVQQSFPFIALAIALVAVVGPGIRTTVLALGIGGWVLFARVVHGQVLSIRNREYIEAARAILPRP